MATTSACAVGSLDAVTRLTPVAMSAPLLAITAAKGPPPLRTFSRASAIDWRMKSSAMSVFLICMFCEGRARGASKLPDEGELRPRAVQDYRRGSRCRAQCPPARHTHRGGGSNHCDTG